MSKIPPEFRQSALKRAGVDRQEVSDRFVFHVCHEAVRVKGDRLGGQLNCQRETLEAGSGRDFLVISAWPVSLEIQ